MVKSLSRVAIVTVVACAGVGMASAANAAVPHGQSNVVSAGEEQALLWCIKGNNVRLRRGPGTNYEIVGHAHNGTRVVYHSVVPGTSWYRISVGNLRNVYVWHKYLTTC